MNSLLETLNVWAGYALRFAWPMLWQSSLLIGVLFALDLALRNKLRPALRYALWLVVVKVLLPPSLAFPTGPSWWLRPAQAVPPKPRPTPVIVTYSTDDQPALPTVGTPVLMPPYRPRLSPAAWALIVTATVSLGLFAWMLVRRYQVARDARMAAAAPAWLGELLPEGQRPARIRLTDRPQSPAVCGLFRPVILLPRSLADHLPPAQMRAVLLHELVHLRRGDVWVNCLQALVQILYWWHPLLWLANARIRRVREEAVDDAVMLALDTEADTYAPTLLEVAKLSLHRPLTSLGLVGILESRSSLRQRIERLLDFRPPRKAGLTLSSVLAVVGFAAVAVPMGEARAPSEVPQSAPNLLTTNNLQPNGLSSPTQDRLAITYLLDRIRLDCVSFDRLPMSEVVRFLVDESKKRDPEKRGINFLITQNINSGGSGAPTASPLGPDGQLVPATAAEPVDINAVTVKINPALTNIRLADVLEAIVKVADRPIKYSIEDHGVVFSLKVREATPLYVRTFKIDPNTFYQGLQNAGAFSLREPHNAGDNRMGGYGGGGLRFITPTNNETSVSQAAMNYFQTLGVDMDPRVNPGKAVFFNDRQGMLLVRATLQDLDIIEAAIQVLNIVPPQINIQCKFVEVSEEDIKALNFDSWGKGAGNAGGSGQVAGLASSYNSMVHSTVTKMMTKPQFDMAMNALQQRQGAQLLAGMEVTTSSGRQAQCRATDNKSILTLINPRALSLPGITSTNDNADAAYLTERLDFGPILDATPSVLEDGYTVEIRVIATLLEFLGYEGYRTNSVAVYVNGKQKWASPPLPDLRQRQMDATARLWDGQTLVLSNPTLTVGDPKAAANGQPAEKPGDGKRRLIVLVTPTIIDSTGKRIHSDEEMPFARDGIPPQPAR